jgi:hypothetical protein
MRNAAWLFRGIIASIVVALGVTLAEPAAAAPTMTRIGPGSGGSAGEHMPSAMVSDDGDIVVFRSSDPSLVNPINANGYRPPQLFVWRRATGTVEQATVSASGVKADLGVTDYSLSGDGRYLFFSARARNLGPPCVGHTPCVFRKDLTTGAVISASPGIAPSNYGDINVFSNRISTTTTGRFAIYHTSIGAASIAFSDLELGTTRWIGPGFLMGDVPSTLLAVTGFTGGSYSPMRQTISDDGRYVLITGTSSSAAPRDLFLVDTTSWSSRRITRAAGGGPSNGSVSYAQITPDGARVLFVSGATNLTGDGVGGAFVYDVATDTTQMASIGADSLPQSSLASVSITDDGRRLFFNTPMTMRDLMTGHSVRLTDLGSAAPFGGLGESVDVAGDGSTIVGVGVPDGSHPLGVYVFDGYTDAVTDVTPPVLLATPDRAPDRNGWYRHPVTVTWSSVDPSPSSGTPSVPPPARVDRSIGAQTLRETSCDPAGNCTTTQITISLDWLPPAVTIGGVASGATYELSHVPTPTCTAVDALSGIDAPCQWRISGGQPDGSGTFTVVAWATDVAGNEGFTSLAYTVEGPDVPATPLLSSLVLGNHSATITWLRPDDGGSPILGYTVTATPGGRTCSTNAPDQLTCTITGLANGVNHTFTVTARNAVGDSPPTPPPPPGGGGTGPGTPVGSGTPGTPPGPVTGVDPNPDPEDGTRVTLRWLAAASDLPIIGYRATAEPGGQHCTTDGALSCTITGLTAGVHYSFTVVAINAIGTSDPSEPVSVPPVVTAITPARGPSVGGTHVTITGTMLAGTTAVVFGDRPAVSFTIINDTTVTAVAPAHAPGLVDVRVSTDAGTSAVVEVDRFTYDPTADARINVSSASGEVALGDMLTQTVVVGNDGPDAATGATATVTLNGVGATVIAAATAAGPCNVTSSTMTCELGTLAAGATAIVDIMLEPFATGTLTTTATALAAEFDPANANNESSQTVEVTNAHGCTIIGTPGNDTIVGTSGADVICALAGADTVAAGGGDDIVHGGSGSDTLDGGNGNDTIYAGHTGSVLIGGNGDDHLNGGSGNDTIHGDNGSDTIDAGAGGDSIYGGNGDDAIDAGDGVDTVNGGNGSDTCAETEHLTSCTNQ